MLAPHTPVPESTPWSQRHAPLLQEPLARGSNTLASWQHRDSQLTMAPVPAAPLHRKAHALHTCQCGLGATKAANGVVAAASTEVGNGVKTPVTRRSEPRERRLAQLELQESSKRRKSSASKVRHAVAMAAAVDGAVAALDESLGVDAAAEDAEEVVVVDVAVDAALLDVMAAVLAGTESSALALQPAAAVLVPRPPGQRAALKVAGVDAAAEAVAGAGVAEQERTDEPTAVAPSAAASRTPGRNH